jgi:transposase
MNQYIGIDVSKSHLDICDGHATIRITNTLTDLHKWVNQVKHQPITLVVCEATGGYEHLLVQVLQQACISVLVEHPNKIRAFGKSKGVRAKTGTKDAQLIFHYAHTLQPTAKSYVLTAETREIKELLKRRNQLLEDKTREIAHLEQAYLPQIKHSIQAHLEYLEQQINSIQQQIDQAATEPSIEKNVALLASIPGVGKQTALTLLTLLPEIEGVSRKSLAALAGVAPFNRESGSYVGKRFIQGGRKNLRKALYMASVASLRWNKTLRQFYDRLRDKGKCAKVALVAVMNKLLAIVRSVYKRQSPWVEDLHLLD